VLAHIYMWQWTGYVGDAKEAKVVVDLVFLQILSNTMLLTFFMISVCCFTPTRNIILIDKDKRLFVRSLTCY